MDAAYVLGCGIEWTRYANESAGLELICATNCARSELRGLARGMLRQAGPRSKELIGRALSDRLISPFQAHLFAFESGGDLDVLRAVSEMCVEGLADAGLDEHRDSLN
jgi:hypothetical protein